MAARPAKQLSARDRRRYEDLKRAREEQYKHALSRLSPLLLSVFLLSILLLALFFCDLSYIHNTDVGREVSVSFWSYALATVSGSFSSPAAVFGDIAVPFYYYAETGHRPHGHFIARPRHRGACARRPFRRRLSQAEVRPSPPSPLRGGRHRAAARREPHLLARPQQLSDPARLLQRQPCLLHPLGRILPAHRGASRTHRPLSSPR